MTWSRRAATGSAATFQNNTWCYLINKTLAQMNAERAAGPARQKKIKSKHNNLLNYFVHDRRDLSPAYVRSCKRMLKIFKKKQ
jgi:hypothetical protein